MSKFSRDLSEITKLHRCGPENVSAQYKWIYKKAVLTKKVSENKIQCIVNLKTKKEYCDEWTLM
ncbi:hypothetical protein K160097B7_01920 [[Clostridium] hylemonae]